MKTKTFNYFMLSFLLLVSYSCHEEEISNPSNFDNSVEDIAQQSSSIPSYPLNWENIEEMPTPSGVPRILVPWASGSSRDFSFEVANDYHQANGWELVYNTFNVTVLEDKLYFILYNKYSGLMRMYFYIPSTTGFIPSANMIHTLEIEGPHRVNSPLLNFSGQSVVDVNIKSRFASIVEKAQVAPGTWYAFQHELAYDQNASSQTSSSFFMKWPVKAAQITEVSLNGNINGSLVGSISIPGVNFSLASSISTTNNIAKNGFIKATGSSESNDLSSLGQAFFSGAEKALEKAGVGIVEGILGGLFGKNSDTPTDNVDLKLEASINLKGTLTQNFLLDSRSFSVPGVDHSQLIGFAPIYDEPLGVFYITQRPTIREKHFINPLFPPFGQPTLPRHTYNYQIEHNSFQIYFNPEVLAIANIRNIRKEVVLSDGELFYPIQGKKENIGGRDHYTGQFVGTHVRRGAVVGTRITFDVVPKDGSPKVTIAKTFKSNIATTNIHVSPGGPGNPGGPT